MKMIQDFFRKNLLILITFILCFFLFEQHEDLDFTARVSMNFYSVNPLHLYDEAVKFGYTHGPGNINYMPSTYILFAIWGLPLKLLSLVFSGLTYPGNDTGYAIFWYKLLPVLFYFGCAILIQKIAKQFLKDEESANTVACLWMVSPFAFFSQFLFGQYDSFTLFFTLLGIYFYFQKKLFRFSIWFGIALTFKYFPLFVYFPMLLLVEKDFRNLVRNTVLFGIPIACVALPFLITKSPEFEQGVLGFGAAHRVSGIMINNGNTSFNFILFAWATLCAYVFFFEKDDSAFKEKALKYGGLGIMILFLLICWHPQWLLFLSPFMLLNFMYRKNFKEVVTFQILLNVIGIATWTQIFGYNVDQNMLMTGVLGKWFPEVWVGTDIARIGNAFLPHDPTLWLALFNAMLVAGVIFTFRNFKADSELMTSADFREEAGLLQAYTWVSLGLFPLLAIGAYLILVFRWFSVRH